MRNSVKQTAGALLLAFMALSAAQPARATETVDCTAKVVWRRAIVETLVAGWYRNESRVDDFLDLIQAEQGIAACHLGKAQPTHLHTPALPRDLRPEELGSLLLANELHWARLLPNPEHGLSGSTFRVIVRPLGSGDWR